MRARRDRGGMSSFYQSLSVTVRSFGMIRIGISDPRSLGSWCVEGIDESLFRVDSAVPLIHHHPSDLGSLILIGNAPLKLNNITQLKLLCHTNKSVSILIGPQQATCRIPSCGLRPSFRMELLVIFETVLRSPSRACYTKRFCKK